MEKEYYYVGITVDEAIKKGLKDLIGLLFFQK